MRNDNPRPATFLAAALASETGDLARQQPILPRGLRGAAVDAEKLVALGKRAKSIAVKRCNGIERQDAATGRVSASWTEADERGADRLEARIAKDATAILQPYGATDVKVGGDPRGHCLTFKLASGRSNFFDRSLWGV